MSAFIRGALFKLPAGDVQALVGGEYRRVDLKSADDRVDGVGGADSSKAAFAELRAPLLSAGHAEARRELLATTAAVRRSEEHTSELQSLMRSSYAVFCLKKKKKQVSKNQTDSRNRTKKTPRS